MSQEVLQATSTLAAVLSALAAIFSGFSAFLSFKHAKKMKAELESDERIIASNLVHPGLKVHDHDECVLCCTLFNKSKRKAHIESVMAFDRNGIEISITWASEIESFGNPLNPSKIAGIVDSVPLYVRKNDGESIEYMCLKVFHSFPDSPTRIVYDPMEEWLGKRRRRG